MSLELFEIGVDLRISISREENPNLGIKVYISVSRSFLIAYDFAREHANLLRGRDR